MTVVYEQTSENVQRDCRTWPAGDRRAWCRLFDPATPGRHALWARRRRSPWARSRQYTAANVYTRYLAHVRAVGLPAAITPEGVRAFVAEQQHQCRPRTIHGQVAMLKAVAQLLDSKTDWTWLDTTCRNLAAVAERTPKRKTAKHLYSARELYAVGVQLVTEGVAAADTNWTTTQKVRDGLWLVLGVMCPERRRALERLSLEEIDPEARRIVIPADRMKTGEASQRTMPAVVAEAVRLWRDHYRAAHADPDHDGFWIAKGGRAVRDTTMAAAMRTVTKSRLGAAVSPHRLRDASATFVVEAMPEHAPLASLILKHRSARMTEEYTETAEQIEASRQVAAHLDAKHAELASSRQCPRCTRAGRVPSRDGRGAPW